MLTGTSSLSPLLLLLLLRGGSQILIKKKMRKRFHFSQIGPHSSKGKGNKMRDGGVKGGRHREKDTQEDKTKKRGKRSMLPLTQHRTHLKQWRHPSPSLLPSPFLSPFFLNFKSPILSSPPRLFAPLSLEKWQTRCLSPQWEGDVTVIFFIAEEQKRKGHGQNFSPQLH